MTVSAAPRLRHKRPLRRKGVRMLQVALPDLAGAVTLGLAAQATIRALATRPAPPA